MIGRKAARVREPHLCRWPRSTIWLCRSTARDRDWPTLPRLPAQSGWPGVLTSRNPPATLPPYRPPQRGIDAGVARTRPCRPRRGARGAADVRARRPLHRHGGHEPAPQQQGLAKTWWWPKPQVGNTHPGATYPLGMVSACAYSGAYPTGYGRYDLGTEGLPTEMYDRQVASGFTHFQQSGTGAIRKYYNYFRVTPMLQPLDDLGSAVGRRRRERRARLLHGDARVGHPRGDHRRPEERCPPVHVPGAPGRAAGHRLLAGRAVHPARADGAAAGAPALDQPGDRAGRDRRRGRSAGHPRGVRRPALAAAALVRPSAHAGGHAAGLRPDPADDAAAVRADVGGAVGARAGGGAAVRVLAAGRRPGTGEPRAGVRAGSVQLRDDAARRPPRPGRRRSARSGSTPRRRTSRPSSRRRSTTR